MEIAFADERALMLIEMLSWEEAKERAWDIKTDVFVGGLGKLFSRPKAADVKISHQEKRWEPFWHVRCSSRYVYERTRQYRVAIPQPEVRTVVVDDREYIPSGEPRTFTVVGLEKCREEASAEILADAVTGEERDWHHYLAFEQRVLADAGSWAPPESIVIPPRIRASAVTREVLTALIKPLDADLVVQDLISIEVIDLYFRPVYAFEFLWELKERKALAAFDGLTGKLFSEGVSVRQVVGKPLAPDVLFDVDVDAIDLLVPGGGIAIKIAQPPTSTEP